MPSAYTEPIYNGENISFEQFANSCLRNFGIYLRWEGNANLGKFEIPDKIEPSTYHKKRYEEYKAQYNEFLEHPVSQEQLETDYIKYVKKVDAENEKRVKRAEALRTRYESMLKKVRKWVVPSEQYQGVKDFMEEQLLKAIEWDCRVDIDKVTPKDEWISFRKNRPDLVDNINYHLQKYQKDVEEAATSTQWLKIFTESIRKVDK